MHELTKLIKDDMRPALGVTEPGAIAYAVSRARSYLTGELKEVRLLLNSGMYKNAYTCGIPNSLFFGNEYAAALGAVAGRPEKELESLADVTEADNAAAEALVKAGRIHVEMSGITSRIFIEAQVKTADGEAMVRIRDSHTNVVRIEANGKTILDREEPQAAEAAEETPLIHNYTLRQIYEYAKTVPAEEISFIKAAYDMNYALFEEGLKNERTTYARHLLKKNGGQILSSDEQKTASLLCNAAIEARVIGLDRPAMSITGSGAHGIIATMPLYGVCKIRGLEDEALYRATALSYLICMYIKEYSGKLSAFCGCGIAAGTGMACALVYLWGGDDQMMAKTINNMASSITGMICHGGNKGCTMKGVVAVDAAFQSAELGMNGIFIDDIHGINGSTPEETMRHMGEIASPGMTGTEKTIVDILQEEATEDIEKMAAIVPTDKPYMKTTVFETWKKRIPWLLLLMISATFTGSIITSFEDALSACVVLTAYIPMLMDTGGNCGSQSATLIIRGIALDEIRFTDLFKVMFKEFRISLIVGAFLAVANGVRIFIQYHNPGLAVVIACSLMGTVIMAKLVGCILPLLAKKVNLDPAIMASPLITTLVDTFSILIYFNIATVLFRL